MDAEEVVTTPEVAQPEVAEQPAEATKPEAEAKPEQEQPAEAGQKPEKDRDEKGRFKGAQTRIDELTRARREAEREAAYWRQMAEQKQEPAPEKPTPDKFADYGEYVEALTDWKAAQAAEKAAAKLLEQRAQVQQAETRQTTWAERVQATQAELTDYAEVMQSADMPVAKHVQEVIVDSELGPRVAYHLAKHPEVLARLNSMSPLAAAREVGKLETSLAQPKAAPPAKLTQAPQPAAVTKATNAASATKDPASMSMDEYRAWRKQHGASWAR